MQIVAIFDPTAQTTGSFTTNLSNGIGKIVIWNESNIILRMSFTDGSQDIAPAWTAVINALNGPSGQINWAQEAQLTSASPPISKVWVVAYSPDELIPGVFPVALVRQTTIGNPVPLGTSSTAIVNTGNPIATPIVTAQVLGDASNAVNLTNDGQLTLGDASHQGGILMPNQIQMGVLAGGDRFATTPTDTFVKAHAGKVVLESTSGQHDAELSSGNLLVNGNITSTVTMNASNANVTHTLVSDFLTANTSTQTPNLTVTGNATIQGTTNLKQGSFTAVALFFGSGTVNNAVHGITIGQTPDFFIVSYAGNFGGPPTESIAWFGATNTTVNVRAQNGYSWIGMAIKF